MDELREAINLALPIYDTKRRQAATDTIMTLITQKAPVAKFQCSDGLWRKPEEPPEDNREVVLLTSFDVYLVRYIDGEWNLPGRYDNQFNEEILGWADKP